METKQQNLYTYNQEFLNNATFYFYKEFIENYVYSLYSNHDTRVDDLSLNQLDNFILNLSEFLVHKEDVRDFFELKNNSYSEGTTANIKKDNFDKAFSIVLGNLSVS